MITAAEQYAYDVRDGKVMCGELERLCVMRHLSDLDREMELGFHFDRTAAMRPISFIHKLKHTKGKWAGQKVTLEPWQQFLLWCVFGWLRADGTRRFRNVYLEVARKNGKTTLMAAVELFMTFADREPRAEVYAVATTRDQAKILFADATAMVSKTGLKNYLTCYKKAITHDKSASTLQPLSSDEGVNDGLSPSCAVIDEYHAHKTNGMVDVIKSGTGSRRQPLMWYITTAGFNKNYPCYLFRKNCVNVLRGISRDESLFVMIFALDEKDEWTDPKNWRKSNPNIGISVSYDYIAEQVDDAKNRPEAVRNVKTKNLNMWVDAEKTWILDSVWTAASDGSDPEELRGMECWGGLDLSNVSDITAFGLCFKREGRTRVVLKCWIPEDTLQRKIADGHADFQRWVDEGYVTLTPGNVTDYDYIVADIIRMRDEYELDIRSVGYDRWNSSQAVIDLTNEGFTMNPFGQGYGSMSAPTKELHRRVLTRNLEHYGNPVLRWMISAVAIQTDPAGNIKPDKAKSSQKIDGVVAVIMALGEMMTAESGGGTSPYEERGLLTL